MKLTSVGQNLRPSATLAINELVRLKQQRGETIYHLGFGESPFPVYSSIQQDLRKYVDHKRYLSTQGLESLRNMVSEFYQRAFHLTYSPDQIIIGPGSKLLLFALMALLDGDLLLPRPSWVSYQHQAAFLKKRVHYIPTTVDENYLVTANSLDSFLQDNNLDSTQGKLLLLNYPCNPTGQTYSKDQLESLGKIIRDYNFVVLSDEIYGLTTYSQVHTSIAHFLPERTFVTGGIAKDRSLGGFRLGVLLIPEGQPELLRAILAFGSETWSCVSTPIQYALIEGYRPTSALMRFIQDCTEIHRLVTTHVYDHLQTVSIRCPRPEGAFYLFPDWNRWKRHLQEKDILNSTALATHLLENYNVATLSGAEFGMPPSNYCLRLATVDYDGTNALNVFQSDRKQAVNYPSQFVETVAPRIIKACEQLKQFQKDLGVFQ